MPRPARYWTPVRGLFWALMLGILSFVAWLWARSFFHPYQRGSDRAGCIMFQRNAQQAVRAFQAKNDLRPGDPLPWSRLIGPRLLLEAKPTCPVHGQSGYIDATTIPGTDTLAMTCRDPEHRPPSTEGW